MSEQAWTVAVEGIEHRISVDVHPEHGRASIRVDGKMATRPLAPEEESCEFPVAGVMYVLRRQPDDTFLLDVTPEGVAALQAAAARQKEKPRKPKDTSPKRFVLPGILLVFAAGACWWVWDATAYYRISWTTWKTPRGEATIQFPSDPRDASRIEKGEGNEPDLKVDSFHAEYRDHLYVFESFGIDRPLYEHEAPAVLTGMVQAVFKDREFVETKDWTVPQHEVIRYVINFPAEDGDGPVTLRGIIGVHQTRVYMAWVQSPQKESETDDVNVFLRSIRMPSGYAYAPDSSTSNLQARVEALTKRRGVARDERRNFQYYRIFFRVLFAAIVLIAGVISLRHSLQ